MFSDELQRARACRGLLAQAGIDHLWTSNGPTEQARELLEQNGGYLSSGQRVFLLAAWEFWDHSTPLRIHELLGVLDAPRMTALCTLLIAVAQGGAAIDDWLRTYGPPPPRLVALADDDEDRS